MAQTAWFVFLDQWEARGNPPPPPITRNLGELAWQCAGCMAAVAAFALAPYGLGAAAVGWVPADPEWLAAGAAVGLVFGPGAVLLAVLLGRLTGDPLRMEGRQFDAVAPQAAGPRPPGAVVGMILLGVVLAPCAEELLFRGVVYPGLRNALGPTAAVLVSAALFGLAHRPFGWTVVYASAVMGIGFALLVEGSGSLWPAVVAHMLLNSKIVAAFIGPFRRPAPPG
jgi:membrane protease YdiL (CAAX protease family)